MFDHVWRVPGPSDRAYDVVRDLANYPSWWPQVRAVAKADDHTARVVVRSIMPYSLEFRLERVIEDRDARILEARLHGELDGTCRWELTDDGAETVMKFMQRVNTPKLPLRAAKLVPWIPRANHSWMMERGETGLRERLLA